MSERDYANDYEAWLADTGGDTGYGGTIPTNTVEEPPPYVPPPPQEPVRETPSDQGPGPMFHEEAPPPPPPTYYPPPDTGGGGGISAPAAPTFNWPTFTPPAYESPGVFKPRNPTFSFADFAAPSMQDAENEPGYAFSRDQGREALETSAAARGLLRSGGTLKDILEYGNKFAEQNYGNVFNRAQSIWGNNRQNALDKFTTEYGIDRDVYDRTAADIGNKNQYNYRSAWDSFNGLDSQRKFELSDALARWQSQLSALTSLSQPVG